MSKCHQGPNAITVRYVQYLDEYLGGKCVHISDDTYDRHPMHTIAPLRDLAEDVMATVVSEDGALLSSLWKCYLKSHADSKQLQISMLLAVSSLAMARAAALRMLPHQACCHPGQESKRTATIFKCL